MITFPVSDGGVLLPTTEGEYSTILAIPPWPGVESPGQASLTTDQLCELPVTKRCGEQSHLYLWTNSRFLVDGFDIMDAWGFTYQACFVCAYDKAQPETPWRDAHHLLLLGIRGNLPFRRNTSRTWLVCERPANGRVPDEILDLIESTSPGPFLMLFGNQNPPSEEWAPDPITVAL